jgi:hypothetical protein
MRSAALSLSLVVLTSVLSLTPQHAAAAQGTPQLLTNVRAADVLADLITYTGLRADARVENIKQYLRETGTEAAFEKARPAAKNPLVPYTELLRGAVVFVSGEGAKFADPSLEALNDTQLSNELATLQVYNIQQFQKLNDQVKYAASAKAFVESRGELEKYRAWAKTKGFAPVTPPKTPEESAARMDEMIKSAKEIAWTKAEAQEMSREEFDKRWADQVKNYRKSVEEKVAGCRSLATALKNPPPAPAMPSNPAPAYVGPPAGMHGGLSSPPSPGVSQYKADNSAAAFRAKNEELWDRWDD